MQPLSLREYLTLLHLPTTSCILAFAIIGGVSAPTLHFERAIWILLQLFLVGGVAANYLDEVVGRPWHTEMPEKHLWIVGVAALLASNLIGAYLSLTVAPWFWLFATVWSFYAVTYDLELFRGLFHNTPSLAVSGASVYLGSYYIQTLTVTPQALAVSLIIGCIAGYGRHLYELAKPVCKDKDPFADGASRSAWTLLKTQILYMNVLSMGMLAYRLLA